jgi:hypothetical protein
MRFQVSMLNLGAALERSAPIGSKEVAEGSVAEAEQLQRLIETHDCHFRNNLQSSADSSQPRFPS